MMQAVAEGIGVPESAVNYEGKFIGGPLSGCAGVFSTPKGTYESALVAWTRYGGNTFFVGPHPAA